MRHSSECVVILVLVLVFCSVQICENCDEEFCQGACALFDYEQHRVRKTPSYYIILQIICVSTESWGECGKQTLGKSKATKGDS